MTATIRFECYIFDLKHCDSICDSVKINASRLKIVKCGDFLALLCHTGVALPWMNDLRYLGVFIIRSRTFKCSLDHAKSRSIVVLTIYLVRLDELRLKR